MTELTAFGPARFTLADDKVGWTAAKKPSRETNALLSFLSALREI